MTENNQNTTDKDPQITIESLIKYETLGTQDMTGERALWQSVVMQAALDATSNPRDVKGKIERAKTISWFSHNNEDFLMVCSFAELNPKFVIQGIKHAIQKNKKSSRKRQPKNMFFFNKLSKPITKPRVLKDIA